MDAATCSHQQSLVVSRQQWRGAKPRGKTRLSEKRPAGSQSYKKTWTALKLGLPLAHDEAHDSELQNHNMQHGRLPSVKHSCLPRMLWQHMPELSYTLSVYISRQNYGSTCSVCKTDAASAMLMSRQYSSLHMTTAGLAPQSFCNRHPQRWQSTMQLCSMSHSPAA